MHQNQVFGVSYLEIEDFWTSTEPYTLHCSVLRIFGPAFVKIMLCSLCMWHVTRGMFDDLDVRNARMKTVHSSIFIILNKMSHIPQ
jgi:hypothetical protein